MFGKKKAVQSAAMSCAPYDHPSINSGIAEDAERETAQTSSGIQQIDNPSPVSAEQEARIRDDRLKHTVRVVAVGAGAAIGACAAIALAVYSRSGQGAISLAKETVPNSGAIKATIKNAADNGIGAVKELSTNNAAQALIKQAAQIKPSGARMTATGLGSEAWASCKEINKRLLENGLMTSSPYEDGYTLTKLGEKFGEYVEKTTRYGHDFVNIEWDSSVLELVYSPEELTQLAAKKARAAAIAAENGYVLS